ncbi:xanthine dehydrogenase small subunit [Nocardioides sp. CFH 31398]|uniref:xanthine dehydrogenase small subunit n=1 Tax=Nocardioides sp. CFH 31398 TaxID=2919579 RepID=UPI001F059059|nr:FAD binding domain-containing protein [Nocardioides sp. CFH 31398]MCH1867851.1 FAD binding domain-containing protein [Nocardioides sp. CFH 31398]
MEAPDVVVNGRAVPFVGATPHTTALDWLRGLGLTGAKEGCAEGECGACSVMVARPGVEAPTEWTALNACLMPAAQLAGQEVVTAEGLADGDTLHPVQAEMAARGGSQCGYCTPGFVCSMAAEFYRPGRREAPRSAEAEEGHECGPNGFDLHALSGNLCRCTGYRPIRAAAYAVGQAEDDDPLTARTRQQPPATTYAELAADGARFVRPADLPALLDLLAAEPDAVLVAGSTDHGVEVNLRGRRPPLTVAVDRLDELRGFAVADDHVELGAALSLTEIERRLAGRLPLVGQMTEQFASRLIRNGATLGGNLGTGSPIGDAAPSLLALEAEVVLASVEGDRTVALADYFTGYRASVRRPGEVIRAVRVPLPARGLTAFHKIAKRRFDDISSVAVGFALDVDDGVVTAARIGLGGVAATPIRARATEAVLEGRPWDAATVAEAADVLGREGTPLDDHRASAAYRAAMLRTSLLKLHAENPAPELEASA